MSALLLILGFLFTPSESKIDPPVLRAMAKDEPIPVLLLAQDQLLDGPEAFHRFCMTEAGARRSILRERAVERLKEIAAGKQQEILLALGNPPEAEGLWIANAVSVRLRPEEIRKAAALKAVKYVYRNDRPRPTPSEDPGGVSEVLESREREPLVIRGKTVPWNLKAVGADRVWSKTGITGEGVVVAMFDAGVRYTHQDLRRNIWVNDDELPNNGRDDDGNGWVDDVYGYDFGGMKAEVMARAGRRPGVEHGTITAGIVAGDGTGGTITGMAPRARVMIVRGEGTYGAARVFQYALENGADVVNMSFSIPDLGNLRGLWRLMCDQATCAGLVLVSGAGNFQQSHEIPVQMRIPEGVPSVICAGGVNRKMEVPEFCSLGPVEWASVRFYEDYPMPKGLVKPDVCGFPGPGYPLLAAKDEGYIDPNDRVRGNSLSGPHVSGAAALVLSANPDLVAWRVKEILEGTANDLGPQGKDTRTGAGLVNAYEAVKAALWLRTF